MRPARSLADLMRIRAYPPNRDYLRSISRNQGTALGLKRRSDSRVASEPAIIVFVPEKYNRKWLPHSELIKPALEIPGELTCPLDVVEGSRPEEEAPVPPSGGALAQRLRGWDEQVWPGSQISCVDPDSGGVFLGTLGAFARQRTGDRLPGFLTNKHVAFRENVQVYHPLAPVTRVLGITEKVVYEKGAGEWYGKAAPESDHLVHVDAAFVGIHPDFDARDLNPGLIALEERRLGPVFEIELEADMWANGNPPLIGKAVVKLGRTTGLRRGTVSAFAYEWQDPATGTPCYTDLLIGPELVKVSVDLEMSIPFSSKGDSGSLVVLEDGKRPVGLLWGGFQEQRRPGDVQENWSYATRLDRILAELDLELVTEASQFPTAAPP